MWIERLGRALEGCGRAPARLGARLPARTLLAAALLVGLVLRVLAIRGIPTSAHEAHYLRDAHAVLERGIPDGLRGSVHGWLATLAHAEALRHWPGASERDLRWIQLGFAMLGFAAVWEMARAAAGERVAAFAVAVHAFTPNAVFYAASAEPYAAHLLLVTLNTAAYVAFVRELSLARGAALALATAVAALHHPVALVNAAALGAHALIAGDASPRARVRRLVPLAIGLVAATPMLAAGQPGHVQNWIGAVIPYFFSIDVVGSIVVFLVLWDACADVFEPTWREVLPWAFVLPVLFWLPYGRLQYLLPGCVPMAIVLGAALTRAARPRVVGAMLVFVGANAVSAIVHWVSVATSAGG